MSSNPNYRNSRNNRNNRTQYNSRYRTDGGKKEQEPDVTENVPGEAEPESKTDIFPAVEKPESIGSDLPEKVEKPEPKPKPKQNVMTIKRAQELVRSWNDAKIDVDGEYTPGLSTELLKAFQKHVGTKVDGMWGFETRNMAQDISMGSSGPLVQIAKAKLVCLGYGPLDDGMGFDSTMEETVRKFQKDNAFPVNGTLDKPTWKRLLIKQ